MGGVVILILAVICTVNYTRNPDLIPPPAGLERGATSFPGDALRSKPELEPDRKVMEVPIEIRAGELLPGIARPLFQTHVIAPRFADTQYDVARDGRFLVNSLKLEAPLTLVPGWTAILRR